MKKKVLVIYARYGSGHKSIAEYVAKYLMEHNPKMEVLLFDMTPYGNALGKLSIKLWDWVCHKRHEKIFDTVYELMDHKITSLGNRKTAKQSYDNLELRQVISEFNPDVTISTHFFCSNMIAYYNELGLTHSKIYTIITDYRTHEFWTSNKKYEDGYIVGNEVVKEELIQRGMDPKKIYPYGLPLNINKINHLDDPNVIQKRYNLNPHLKTILFFGGSALGSMYYYDYLKELLKLNLDINIVFICGKNTKLKDKCDKLKMKKGYSNLKVLGYSTDVLNLMKVSDLVISKPGGATVTECLEMRVPMVLVPGVGGQEKYNARFIMKKRYGFKVKGLHSFKKTILKINNNPSILDKTKERLLKLDNNHAVEKINNLISK